MNDDIYNEINKCDDINTVKAKALMYIAKSDRIIQELNDYIEGK